MVGVQVDNYGFAAANRRVVREGPASASMNGIDFAPQNGKRNLLISLSQAVEGSAMSLKFEMKPAARFRGYPY